MKFGRLSAAAGALCREAMSLVDSDRSDEDIRAEIRLAAGGDGRVLQEAARHAQRLWEGPDDFLSDRAKRVFVAAASDASVAPPDPALRDTFGREKALHSATRDDAIRTLWGLSHELEAWCQGIRADAQARPRPLTVREAAKLQRPIGEALARLIGPNAHAATDPLLRSPLAAQIVDSWVWDVSGLTEALALP